MLGFKGFATGGDYDRRYRIDASHPQGTIPDWDVWVSKVDLRLQCGMPCSKLEVSTVQHGTLSGAGYLHQSRRVDVKTIGRELNVRYVLEGSVQRGGNRMRVNVQLSDAETGNHLWAERFDKPLADLFDMQDEIVAPGERAERPARRRRSSTRGTGSSPRLDGLLFSGFGLVQ